jgi:signal transduction histidine kinase
VGVSAGVVLAFIAATAIAQGVQRAITSRATDMITNAMPSVKFLSAARGDLHRMERDVEHAEASESERAEFERQAVSARQDIDEALATYVSLPFFPQEKAVFGHVSEALAVLDTHYAAWKAAPSPATLATLRSDIALVDTALERSITFDADQGQRLGLEIEEVRGSSIGLVVLVEAIAVLFAIGVVVLAVRQLRRTARDRRLEDAARERRESELREANEALGQFAGRVAHDVRSPLAATMLSLDVMRQSPRCQNDTAALKAMDRGAAALQRVQVLVEGLLEFARAGGKPDASAKAEMRPLLRELCDGLATEAEEQNIALVLGPVPAGFVACSRGVLTSIVSNLVRNALKYMGDARERRIDLRVIDASTRWHIDVSDTGPGIPEDQQRRIFEPYVRVAKAGAGLGLGLATVDRLVRAHGGTVGVRSQVGAGSTFSVELPKFVEVEHTADAPAMQPSPA